MHLPRVCLAFCSVLRLESVSPVIIEIAGEPGGGTHSAHTFDGFRGPYDGVSYRQISALYRRNLVHQGVMAMQIDVITATSEDKPIIERLLQLYEHDNSEFFGADLDPDGLYRVADLDALWQPSLHVFLVQVDHYLAGFAFVTRHPSYLNDGECWLMEEFFIMHKYRRKGVGGYVARTLFDQFPGRWEVSEWPTNLPSLTFWRSVIGRYTESQFDEEFVDTPRIHGFIQAFESGDDRP